MTDTPRYLITTADERTWKFDRPVIFLGEWCRRYDRRHIWSKMDAIVAAPYGLGQARKDKDHALARTIEAQLLPVLRDELNRFHGTNHSLRYWRVVLGHWLRRYVDVVFNRYHTLQQCLENYPIRSTTVMSSDSYHLATQDSNSLIRASNNDTWNNVLCARVMERLPCERLTTEHIPMEDGHGFRMPEGKGSESLGSRLKHIVRRQVEAMTNLFVRDDDAFIVSSYLPRVEEAKLHVSLGQVPKLWRSPELKQFAADSELRKSLTQRVSRSSAGGLENCVAALLFELLPSCYLEGFGTLCAQTQGLPWPAQPSFIFTSNNFDVDEIFKCWAASKAEDGIPYYAGQHGSNYGTYRYANPSVEELTADKFLTWGWTDGLPQHSSAFIFKTAGTKPQSYHSIGGLLLIETGLAHRTRTWDGYPEFEDYFNEQQAFVASLDPLPRGQITIRLFQEYKMHDRSEDVRWQVFDPHLNIETGAARIRDLIGESRLVVHSYDSTGILEGLSQNIPTIAFWQDGLSHLRDGAKPYYQLLVDAGIVHLSPESAAKKVNEIWNDVPTWWESNQVQAARRQFCDRYARISERPISDLKRILTTK